MVEVYVVQMPEGIPAAAFEQAKGFVSEEKKRRLRKFIQPKDAARCLVADLLVRTVVCSKLSLSNPALTFGTNEYGKPFLTNYPGLHYNVSHSGEWVAAAFDSGPVGIDVERIASIDFQVADRFFAETESKDLQATAPEARLAYFYDLWTLKESYIKADGRGLSIPLQSFSIRKMESRIELNRKGTLPELFFKQYPLDAGHKLSVCATHTYFAETSNCLLYSDLLGFRPRGGIHQ